MECLVLISEIPDTSQKVDFPPQKIRFLSSMTYDMTV